MKLCNDLKLKPWKAFNEMNVDPKEGVTKKKFLKWWFSSGESASSVKKAPLLGSPIKFRRSSSSLKPACPSDKSAKIEDAMKKLAELQAKAAEVYLFIFISLIQF